MFLIDRPYTISMQVEKTKDTYVFNKDRELEFKGDKIFFKGTDITSISEKTGKNFIAVMGRAGGKSFHNYFGLDPSTNKWYKFTGVTSALDYVGDKNNLMQWYANQVVEQFGWSKQLPDENAEKYNYRMGQEMGQKISEFLSLDLDAQIEFVKKARTAATTYARRTANLGKEVHEEIEKYIKLSISDYQGVALQRKHENVQVQHFIDWAVKNKAIFKASELRVHSKSYWYAGTLDLVVELDGSLYLGDIKTTSSVWGRTYFAQCAAYRLALEEMYPDTYTFAGSIIIRIGRDGLFNPEEDIHFSQYYDDDKKFFLAGLEIYRQENNVYQK